MHIGRCQKKLTHPEWAKEKKAFLKVNKRKQSGLLKIIGEFVLKYFHTGERMNFWS